MEFLFLSVLQRLTLSVHTATGGFCIKQWHWSVAFFGPDIYLWSQLGLSEGIWMEHRSPSLTLENQLRAHALLVVSE